MSIQFTVPLTKVISTMKLEVAYMPQVEGEILVSSADINRPGLQLVGFFDYFDNQRVQLIGKSELAYLSQLTPEQEEEVMEKFMAAKPVAVIQTRSTPPSPVALEKAKKYGVPLLVTPEATTNFSAALTAFLNIELAPRITRHGVLVEVYGEGVLLLGDSGVGKSETAIELVKRGHRLIADDAVEIRRVSNKTLVGSSPANIRHFLELRGIGIINVRRIFGIGAVKVTGRIDMLMNMEIWSQNKVYDRMGMEDEYTDILGLSVPSITIPVKPGRNLAMIIEVAAMNNRQKKLGYNAAHELLARLGMAEDIPRVQRPPVTDYEEFYY
ncbi:MAG: HPr(Ser) kinase/phosphatase [Angelakisella sp.]|jgi:HPr kinase/phosphorylase|nr:HPr(Ser) kinase/phosphatase [Angelakisella sp.]